MALKTKYGVNDLVLLENITNEGVLEALEKHFGGDEIYVYIGQVLISTNPFKQISGLYSDSTLKKYKGKNEHQNQPHVYAIAERAYRKMVQDLSKECVIITGESGSGKTEASKKIMEYIAAVSSKSKEVQKVKEQLLESNPFLEAFGNAKTMRNNNSSRFGKYMEIQFDVADPVGGKISVYLLEKNRVIERQQGERNFHIFYQMIAGASSSEKAEWKLGAPESFHYLKNSESYTVNGINDSAEYKETRTAMNVIGLTDSQQSEIFQLLAAILHLGNVQFSGNSSGSSVSNDEAQTAASLLKIAAAELSKELTHKLIKTGREQIEKPLGPEEARYARDSLAKGIYGRLFKWLVDSANRSIHVEYYSNTIGVLDIYGFEIFGVNGFEQLCINYVNEKLHQLFIELTLEGEQKEYMEEGIEWENIDYYNNKPICDLVEARGNLFSLLDEESIFPKGSDQSLFEKLDRQLKQNKNFVIADRRDRGFLIKHYAGDVTYSTNNFIDKNKDLMFPNLIKMASTSNNTLLKELFAADEKAQSNKRPKTSCVQFKSQVASLMTTLRGCRQHYIRCIKPNDDKRPNGFTKEMVMSQVKYLGLLENVKVRRAGFAYRIPFEEFLAKYKACSSKHIKYQENQKEACEGLIKDLGLKDYKMGKTKVFIRSPATLFKVEDMRTAFLAECAARIPPEDQLIYADKVIGFNKKGQKVPFIFMITAQNCFVFPPKGKAFEQKVTMQELQGISLGDSKDGFLVLSCKEVPKPVDPKSKKEPVPPRQWEVLIENVFKKELLNVVEVLRTSGITVDCHNSDVIPESTDPTHENYAPPEHVFKGTKAKRSKCSIM